MEYRLNRYISSSGICSRREADRFIEEGKVTVNGKRAVIGMRVLPGQKVMVNGLLVTTDVEPVYIAFNKPVGIVSTTDTREKDNIVDYIGHEQRIFPIGRLDKDSQGLLLLTNDGDIVNKILRVGNSHKKEYIVTVDKPVTDDFLLRMSRGVPILDRVTRKCEITRVSTFVFRIVLTQGLNRQIRRMCEYFEYEVTKLERIQIMNIKLGNLKRGQWRTLTEKELGELFDMIEGSENTVAPSKAKTQKAPPSKTAVKPSGNTSPRTKSRDGRSSENSSSGGRSSRTVNNTRTVTNNKSGRGTQSGSRDSRTSGNSRNNVQKGGSRPTGKRSNSQTKSRGR